MQCKNNNDKKRVIPLKTRITPRTFNINNNNNKEPRKKNILRIFNKQKI